MDRQEALSHIARAGMSDEAVEMVSEVWANRARVFDLIRSDKSRNKDYVQAEIAKAYVAAQREVDAKLAEMAERHVKQDRRDSERVFGTLGLPGDAASLTISRRDATDRVGNINDSGELTNLLARATRAGDEVLARAVAERATEISDIVTMQKFLDDRPLLEEAGERLWNAQLRGDADLMSLTFQVASGHPPELANMRESQIEHLASAAETVA